MHQEIVENFIFRGFSFPVLLPIAVFKVNDRGTKFLDVNMDELADRVAWSLLNYPYAYSGGQLNFIRKYMDRSPQDLAGALGVSEHQLLEWETIHDQGVLPEEKREKLVILLREFFFAKKEDIIKASQKNPESWKEFRAGPLSIGELFYRTK